MKLSDLLNENEEMRMNFLHQIEDDIKMFNIEIINKDFSISFDISSYNLNNLNFGPSIFIKSKLSSFDLLINDRFIELYSKLLSYHDGSILFNDIEIRS